MLSKLTRTLIFGLASAGLGASSYGLTFNLNNLGGVGPGTSAEMGFQTAANLWSGFLSDSVTVNLNVGFMPLPPGVLGSAGATQGNLTYAAFKNALTLDQTTPDDAIAVANLPAGPALDIYINRTADNPNGAGSATAYVDNDGGPNNTQIRITNANAKALGIGPLPGPDASITFSSLFPFDFNPGDGIGAGLIDFVGVAFHEIGHALGFVSGVDILDINSPPVNGPFNDDLFTFVSSLDLYRNSPTSFLAGADIDWTASPSKKDFSIDGGATILADFATGVNFGDGDQASHWKDNAAWGILDPTSVPAGMANVITPLDIQAMDVIGWDRVIPVTDTPIPEPITAMFGCLGLTALATAIRRRRTA